MTSRRQFGVAIVACIAGAGLVLLALRQGWARVDYAAPRPLPSGSIPVSGQDLLPAAGALALAALACLAAIIATRGLARRVAGAALAGLGVWIAAEVTQPLHAATVIAAASGQAVAGGLGGSLPGGNSAIGGSGSAGGGLPEIGAASRVVLDSGPWRALALAGAVAVIAAGLLAAWRGPSWAVMSARFDPPARQPAPGGAPVLAAAAASPAPAAESATAAEPATTHAPGTSRARPTTAGQETAPAPPSAQGSAPGREGTAPEPAAQAVAAAGPDAPYAGEDDPQADSDAAALWEALDRGVDLTDTPGGTGTGTGIESGTGSTGTAGAPGVPRVAARAAGREE